MNKTKIITGVR